MLGVHLGKEKAKLPDNILRKREIKKKKKSFSIKHSLKKLLVGFIDSKEQKEQKEQEQQATLSLQDFQKLKHMPNNLNRELGALYQKVTYNTNQLSFLEGQESKLKNSFDLLADHTHYNLQAKKAYNYIKAKEPLFQFHFILSRALKACLTGAETISDRKLALRTSLLEQGCEGIASTISVPILSAVIKGFGKCLGVSQKRNILATSQKITAMFESDNRDLLIKRLTLVITIHHEQRIREIAKETPSTLKKIFNGFKDIGNWCQQIEGNRIGDEARELLASIMLGIDKTTKETRNLFIKKEFDEKIIGLVDFGFKYYGKAGFIGRSQEVIMGIASKVKSLPIPTDKPTVTLETLYKTKPMEKWLKEGSLNNSSHCIVFKSNNQTKPEVNKKDRQEDTLKEMFKKIDALEQASLKREKENRWLQAQVKKLARSTDVYEDVVVFGNNQQQLLINSNQRKGKTRIVPNKDNKEEMFFVYKTLAKHDEHLKDLTDSFLKEKEEREEKEERKNVNLREGTDRKYHILNSRLLIENYF